MTPFQSRHVSEDWRDMGHAIYATMSKRPVEYLFLLDDGRYIACTAPSLSVYKRESLTEAVLTETAQPIGWRFLRMDWMS